LSRRNRGSVENKHYLSDEPLSQEYRKRAEECRRKAETFRDPKARARMLDVAAEYERKSKQAEALEGRQDKTR